MKTIIQIPTRLSKYILDDSAIIDLKEKSTEVSFNGELNMVIGDLDFTNSEVIENVTPPEDWKGNKYLFENGTWTLNPEYIEPIERADLH